MDSSRIIGEYQEPWIPKFQATGKIQGSNLDPTEERECPSPPDRESSESQVWIRTLLHQSEEPLCPVKEVNSGPNKHTPVPDTEGTDSSKK